MKHFSVVLALAVLGAPTANATPITTIWRVSGLSQYDYPSASYETPSVPTAFDLSITFPSKVTSAVDSGQTTITYFGDLGATVFRSPLTAYVGSDPFGTGLAGQTAYTFPNVSDYPTTFFEEFAAQSNAYSSSGDQFWAYHIEMRARRYTASRGGTGNADYAFTTPTLSDFLTDVMVNPQAYQFVFNESWQIFDRGTNEYLAGKSWSSYDGNIALASVSVPEPATVSLLGVGLVLLSLVRHKRAA